MKKIILGLMILAGIMIASDLNARAQEMFKDAKLVAIKWDKNNPVGSAALFVPLVFAGCVEVAGLDVGDTQQERLQNANILVYASAAGKLDDNGSLSDYVARCLDTFIKADVPHLASYQNEISEAIKIWRDKIIVELPKNPKSVIRGTLQN